MFDEIASKQLKASNHNVATFSCDFLTPYTSKKAITYKQIPLLPNPLGSDSQRIAM